MYKMYINNLFLENLVIFFQLFLFTNFIFVCATIYPLFVVALIIEDKTL